MKVGFTGTREGMTQSQKEQFVLKFYELNVCEFHHGDCRGADEEANNIVREFFPDVFIVIHPPRLTYQRAYCKGDEIREPDDYLPRDRRIVDYTDALIGAPKFDKEDKSGSWYTIRYARASGKDFYVMKR